MLLGESGELWIGFDTEQGTTFPHGREQLRHAIPEQGRGNKVQAGGTGIAGRGQSLGQTGGISP